MQSQNQTTKSCCPFLTDGKLFEYRFAWAKDI
jgi:hypothetical protein